MQIVIDIPEEMYEWVNDANKIFNDYGISDFIDLVKNGTPLPTHHGRLIDADRLRSMYSINRANFNTVVGIQKWVDNAPTIIEAYKEVQEWR